MLNLEGLPSSALFQDFCDALAKRLEHDWVQGTAIDIKRVVPDGSGVGNGADATNASGDGGNIEEGGQGGPSSETGSAGSAGDGADASEANIDGGDSGSGDGSDGSNADGGGIKYEVTTTHTLPDGTKEDRTLIADAVILATGPFERVTCVRSAFHRFNYRSNVPRVYADCMLQRDDVMALPLRQDRAVCQSDQPALNRLRPVHI